MSQEFRIGVYNGDLRLGYGSVVYPEDSEITVNGRVIAEGDVKFEGSLKALSLRVRDGDIRVNGNLEVEYRIEVRNGSLRVSGDVKAEEIVVEKELKVGGKVEAQEVEVGGVLRANTVIAEEVSVGGSVKVEELHMIQS